MKITTTLFVATAFALAASSTFAAGKPCEELKTEIAGKLDAKGVKDYTLTIIDASDKAADDKNAAKVVGTCEGGAKKITYAKK